MQSLERGLQISLVGAILASKGTIVELEMVSPLGSVRSAHFVTSRFDKERNVQEPKKLLQEESEQVTSEDQGGSSGATENAGLWVREKTGS